MILILTEDLMMASSVSAAARQIEQPFKSVRSIEKVLTLAEVETVSVLLVDLQIGGLEIAAAGAAIQSLPVEKRPRCIAYAQHVHVDLLTAARSAGFDQVLTRGQVSGGIAELLGGADPRENG